MINPTKGKNVDDYRSQGDPEERKLEFTRILVPYLILMGTQIPLSLVYLRGLWTERLHYQLMPVSIVACGIFVFLRWPRSGEPMFFPSFKSDFFLITGVLAGIAGALLLSPWLGFASLLCVAASLLARTNDRQVFGTLLAALAPLVILLQPPVAVDFDTVQGDIQLMSLVNSSATHVASDILDLMQYVHNVSGSRMEFPQQAFDTTTLGTRSLSLFTLLIVTGLFIAWQRRPMFRAAVLLVAACFWAMTFEAIDLVICCIADTSFEKDFYSPGAANRMLQVAGLVGAGIMTLMSDSLISFLFGPVHITAIDEDISYQDMVCKLWNRAIAGVVSPVIDVNIKKEVSWAKRRSSTPPPATSKLLFACVAVLGVFAVIQIAGLASAASSSGDSVYDSSSTVKLNAATLPSRFNGFTQGNFHADNPEFRTPYDVDDSHWVYTDDDGIEYEVVISQPLSGWHDIILETTSYDWQLLDDPEFRRKTFGNDEMQYVRGSFRNSLADHRIVYSGLIDEFGYPFEVPFTWKRPGEFFGRLLSRWGNRTRPRILSFRSIEITVLADTIGPGPDLVEERCEQLFHQVTEFVVASVRDATFVTGTHASPD